MSYIPAELRRNVIRRANNCCEYCLMPQDFKFFSFEIDHIVALKHDGETVIENLCLSCPDCNLYKGSDIASIEPITGDVIALFNPRIQHWSVHFEVHGAQIIPLTSTGRVTARLLKFNDPERIEERAEMIEMGLYPPHELD